VQRTVLYLGEIIDQQQVAWRKTLSVFDGQQQEYANLSLFPDDREIPADAVDSLQLTTYSEQISPEDDFGVADNSPRTWLCVNRAHPRGREGFAQGDLRSVLTLPSHLYF
jgi:hypothetical protein